MQVLISLLRPLTHTHIVNWHTHAAGASCLPNWLAVPLQLGSPWRLGWLCERAPTRRNCRHSSSCCVALQIGAPPYNAPLGLPPSPPPPVPVTGRPVLQVPYAIGPLEDKVVGIVRAANWGRLCAPLVRHSSTYFPVSGPRWTPNGCGHQQWRLALCWPLVLILEPKRIDFHWKSVTSSAKY